MANVNIKRVGSNRVVSLPQRAADALVRYGTFEYAEAGAASPTPRGRFAAQPPAKPVGEAKPKGEEAGEPSTQEPQEEVKPTQPLRRSPAAVMKSGARSPMRSATAAPISSRGARTAEGVPPPRRGAPNAPLPRRAATPAAAPTTAELEGKTKAELVDLAKSYGIKMERGENKASLLDRVSRYRRRDMRADK